MNKAVVFVKSHWMPIAGVIVAFVAYRSLSGKIDSSTQTSSTPETAGSAQAPIIYPAQALSAGGYDSVAGVSSGVSGGSSDSTTAGMLAYLTTLSQTQAGTNSQAIAASAANATQATALNSGVTNSLASAFSNLLGSWSSDSSNRTSTLNVSATPNATGGLNLIAKKDINLDSMPTIAQSSNFASNVVSLFTTPTAKAVDMSMSNFNAAAFAKANPTLFASKKWFAGETNANRSQQLYNAWQASGGSTVNFTPLKTG